MSTISQNAKAIFLEAVDKHSPDEWPHFVNKACGGDLELRQRVVRLLQAHQENDSLFDRVEPTVVFQPREESGDTIGHWKLRERLGAGGMGVVWAAERKKPIHQKVALKVIKPGMDSEQVLARFETERKALALMDHPNIARVLDAGTTEQGRPYFVMELICGVPITEYCDGRKLSVTERLELLIRVCKAVQHAHQKGIIHRDIKPSNVLVTEKDGEAVPKVIDFGVAKALHGRLTEASVYTNVFQAIGTLSYMSPEQAGLSSDDIDTRADIFSLGVLMFELLTGAVPLSKEKLERAAIDEAFRVIREIDPPKPSTTLCTDSERAITISQRRGTDPKRLLRDLRGDLDNVVVKALAKDRSQRYGTASELSDDVSRVLRNEPVQACPPSVGYRLKKLWHANRLAISTTASIILLLALGLGIVGRQAHLLNRNQVELRNQHQIAVDAGDQAKSESERVRALLQVAHMEQAANELRRGFVSTAKSLLNRYIPDGRSSRDYRKFEWHYLHNMLRSGTGQQLYNSHLPAHSVSVSTSGILAVAYFENVVLINLRSGNEILGWRLPTKQRHTDFPNDGQKNYWAFPFAFISKDGRYLAYVSPDDDGVLLLTDLRNDQTLEYPDHAQAVRGAAISPVAPIMVSVDHDGIARSWDIEKHEKLQERQLHDGLIWDVAISPDGKWAATSGADNKICVWSLELDESFTLEGHYTIPSTVDGVISVAFSPDGKLLASGAADRTIRVWDLAERKTRFVMTGHTDEVRSVAFSPDGAMVASGGRDNSVRLWDVRSGRLRALLRGPEQIAHSVVFSPDGKQVHAASFDGTVTAWNASTQNSSAIWCNNDVQRLALSRGGDMLTVIERDSQIVRRWRLPENQPPQELPPIKLDGTARDVALSALDILATADDSGQVRLWDVSSEYATERELSVPSTESSKPRALQFSNDGEFLAVGRLDGVIGLLNMSTQRYREFNGHDHPVLSMAFSMDSRVLVSSAVDGRVLRWDLTNDRSTALLASEKGFRSVSISKTDLLAIGGLHQIELYDLRSGEHQKPIPTGASSACFLDEATLVIAGGGARQRVGEIRLWDLNQDFVRFTLMGHGGAVESVAASWDGSLVVSGSFGGELRIWRGPRHRQPG